LIHGKKIQLNSYEKNKGLFQKGNSRQSRIPYIIEGDNIEMMFFIPSDPDFGGYKFQIAKV
jgi:hypothetical protein